MFKAIISAIATIASSLTMMLTFTMQGIAAERAYILATCIFVAMIGYYSTHLIRESGNL